MLSDEPFVPEAVEQQIADHQESAQDKHAQPQTSNLHLIQNLQQLYQACQADPEGVNRAYQRLLQHEVHSTLLTDRKTGSFSNTLSNPKSRKTEIGSRKHPFWHPRLIAAILLIGVLLTGSFFTFLHLPALSPAQQTFSPTPPHSSASILIGLSPQPLLYQNTLYVISGSDIRAYAAQNGAFERAYPLPVVGNATIVNGVLYASNTTSTFALRLSDGKLLWQAPFGEATTPIIVGGVFYASAEAPNKVVYALQTNDGKLLWQYHFDNQDEALNPPLVVQGVVYFSTYLQLHQAIDARIYALKATNGSLLWHQSLGHTAISNLQTDGSTLYVFIDGYVEALHADGSVMWRSSLAPLSQLEMSNTYLPTVSHGMVYVRGGNGTIYVLRVSDGTLLWRYQPKTRTFFGSFSIQGNVLYVGVVPVSRGYSFLLAFRISDGHLLWQRQLAWNDILNPTAGQGVIYVVYPTGSDGRQVLIALRATNGSPLWSRTLLPSS